MRRTVWDLFFLGILVVILFSVPLAWMSAGWKWNNLNVENRVFAKFPTLSLHPDELKQQLRQAKTGLKRLLQGDTDEALHQADAVVTGLGEQWVEVSQVLSPRWHKAVEEGASDQFPMRFEALWLSKQIERGLISSAYLALPDQAIPASTSGYDPMVLRDKQVYFNWPKKFNAETRQRLDQRLQNLAGLIERYPQIRFYMFYIDHLDRSALHPAAESIPKSRPGRQPALSASPQT